MTPKKKGIVDIFWDGIFLFFLASIIRLSARISDFENILLMVHVGGVHACAAGARYATFFFTNARF